MSIMANNWNIFILLNHHKIINFIHLKWTLNSSSKWSRNLYNLQVTKVLFRFNRKKMLRKNKIKNAQRINIAYEIIDKKYHH